MSHVKNLLTVFLACLVLLNPSPLVMIIGHLQPGVYLDLIAEPANPFDKYAVRIRYRESLPGYLTPKSKHVISRLLHQNAPSPPRSPTLPKLTLNTSPNTPISKTSPSTPPSKNSPYDQHYLRPTPVKHHVLPSRNQSHLYRRHSYPHLLRLCLGAR